MNAILKSLNWRGIIVAALFLWSIRFALLRIFDPSNASGVWPVAGRRQALVREWVGAVACLIIATSLAVIQGAFAGDLRQAIGVGFLLSIVPAAVLIGVGIGSPRTHGTARAAGIIAGVIACSMIIHAFPR